MRARVRLFVLVLVLSLLGGVVWLVARNLWEQRQRDLARKALELVPGVSQAIRDFRRVKVQDGHKVWEVAAKEAQYFDAEHTVVVRNAVLQWFLKDGRVVGLTGEEGRIVLADQEVSRVELSGAIEVSLAEYTLRTDRAVYDRQRDMISAPGPVAIVGKNLQVTGDGMEVDVAAQRFVLLRNVASRMEPARQRG